MKNKKYILIGGLVVLIIAIVAIVLCVVLKDDKKKEEPKAPEKTDMKYEINETEFETLKVTNIELESFETDSILRLTIKNNSDLAYEAGNLNFKLLNGTRTIEEVSSFITGIEAHSEVEVEIILNGVYGEVTDVIISK